MAKQGIRFAEFKSKALGCAVYQRGPDDIPGQEQDAEWRAALQEARTWARAAEALPWRHQLSATAACAGDD